MSILIRGMEMPKSCDDCRLNNGISCYAVLEYTEDGVVGRTDDRPDWCPLVPVPPHGDLIARDALMKGEGRYIISFGKEGIDVAEINRAPTIIPAEEGET